MCRRYTSPDDLAEYLSGQLENYDYKQYERCCCHEDLEQAAVNILFYLIEKEGFRWGDELPDYDLCEFDKMLAEYPFSKKI